MSEAVQVLQHKITTTDGLKIATYECGNPDGQDILFIHGFSQAAMCWKEQFNDPDLAQKFRMVALDLRGHGASDKPDDLAYYQESRQYADDIKSVIDGLGLNRPILVAWSYGGRIMNDYITAYGDGDIGGVNFVGARTNSDPAYVGNGSAYIREMMSDDLLVNVAATRNFVRACFEEPVGTDLMEELIAYNMVIPAKIRAAHITRSRSDGSFMDQITVPVLVTQGERDQMVMQGLGIHTANRIKSARLSLYDAIGHVPFVEDSTRFNRELTEFADECLAATNP